MKVINIHTEGWLRKVDRGGPGKNLPTEIFKGTLRSGQFLGAKGNIVIIGDVHQEAEVVAYGDILVLGSLRGVAHAGAGGNEKAIIWALHFQPTQVRIADHITRPPDGERRLPGKGPEVAFIKEGIVTIEGYPEGSLERRKFFERILEG